MEFRSYNRELAYANMLFKRPFSNISIERDGKLVNFTCVIGNRSRIFKNLENPTKKAMYKLPMIIIQRTGISKNDDRLANVWNEIKYSSHSSKLNYDIFTPVPIDITYDVTIISKYQGDIDMAVSNFIPFFNKDLYFSCQHPKFKDLTFTNQVIMENQINEEHPDEIDPTADDVVTATCQFTYKTCIFCGNGKTRKVIKNVISSGLSVIDYHGLSDILSSWDLTDFHKISSEINQDYQISGIVTKIVDTQISVPVSTIISTEEEVTDGLIPQINLINLGFYAVPLLSDHVEYMDYVDSLSARGYDDRIFADRFIMRLDKETSSLMEIENLYPVGDWNYDGNRSPALSYEDVDYPGVPM